MAANGEVQRQGRYQRITDQDRGRLIDVFENNDADYLTVADTLKIKHATARSIVTNYFRAGKREKLGCKEWKSG